MDEPKIRPAATDSLEDKLVVGISTRALFDLNAANDVFERDGLAAYREYQRARENDVLGPGTGFGLVKGLLEINRRSADEAIVEVILISRNDADSSMRVFNSIEAHGLSITRGAFRGGRDPWPYLPAFHCDLFLSAEPTAVRAALDQGTPAALVLAPPGEISESDEEVRIAFDGDAVLFDEESDLIYSREGPEAFFKFETEHADDPLSPGPFRPFLEGLARIQAKFPEDAAPIRTALVTARSAPAHKRVVNTFRAWGIRVDEAYFLGGIDKAEILRRFQPHIFFDDNLAQLERAAAEVPSAHVPARGDQLTIFARAGNETRLTNEPTKRRGRPTPKEATKESPLASTSRERGQSEPLLPEIHASEAEEPPGGPSKAEPGAVAGRPFRAPEGAQ